MGPVRTITKLLLDPIATAITGWSESPTAFQTRLPVGPPGPRSGAPPGRDLRGLGWFLGLGLVGLAVLLTGVIWDTGLHARNPGLVHQEDLFTLSNPGHLLLFVGLVTVALGIVGATWTQLGLTADPRRSRRARCLLLLGVAYLTTLSVVAVNRAANAESAAHGHGAGHVHAAGGQDETGTGRTDAAGGQDESDTHAHATGPCRPTSAQVRAARKLATATRGGLARFADLRDARRAGYAPHVLTPRATKHYFNAAYVTDGRVLDPTRPEGLLYAHSDRGPVLVAAVYLMNRAGEPGREVGGCLTRWHVHDELCSRDPAKGMISGVRTRSGSCPPGQVAWAGPLFLHAWTIDVPGGAFAQHVAVRDVFGQLQATPRPR